MMFGGFEAGWAYAPMPPDASAAVPRVALRSPAGSQVKVTFQLRVIGFNRHVIASRLSLPTAQPAPPRTSAGTARLLSGEKRRWGGCARGDLRGAGGAGRGHSGEGAISRWPARMAGSSSRSNPVRTDIPSQAVGHIPARGNPVRADILSQAAGHIPA